MDHQTLTGEAAREARADSAGLWMLRGLLVGTLLVGAANAVSFFFRSDGWGSLLGHRAPNDEAIGFPLAIWVESGGYGTHPIRWIPLGCCVLSAVVIGLLAGAVAMYHRERLNAILSRFSTQADAQIRLRFTIRGLMITTMLAAITVAAVRSFTPRVEILAAIYLCGPITLIGLAFLPRGWRWQQRVALLTPTTVALIVAAMALGQPLGVEFDKVMMGIFICWTPQSVLGAAVLTVGMLYRELHALGRTSVS
ncbi:MAG: hypothetical protein AAFX06_21730 [Planctomycetota bacterium]